MSTISVIIATRNRPEMLREAVAAALSQTYGGPIEVIVVFDQSEPDYSLERSGSERSVRVIGNSRSPGLAGARNSGIEKSHGEFIAFCDDDDYWLPGKLSAQIRLFENKPSLEIASCGVSIEFNDEQHDRQLIHNRITFGDLLRDRHTELHPSTFLIRKKALVDNLGLVDETVPGGFGEDYEFLLRAARSHPIDLHTDCLTVVRWGDQSYFFQRWETMAEGLSWLLAKYPEFNSVPAGYSRICGQIAFANAALGQPRSALRWAAASVKHNPLELRATLACAVLFKLISPNTVMSQLHKRGRGI